MVIHWGLEAGAVVRYGLRYTGTAEEKNNEIIVVLLTYGGVAIFIVAAHKASRLPGAVEMDYSQRSSQKQ